MKKSFLTIGVLMIMLFLTGCGEKKLTCTNESNDEDNITDKVTVTFKDDKATKLEQVIEMKLPDGQDKDSYYTTKIGPTENYYRGKTGVGYEAIKKSDVVGAKIVVDATNASSADKVIFFSDNGDLGYDAIKGRYTNLNYTCK